MACMLHHLSVTVNGFPKSKPLTFDFASSRRVLTVILAEGETVYQSCGCRSCRSSPQIESPYPLNLLHLAQFFASSLIVRSL